MAIPRALTCLLNVLSLLFDLCTELADISLWRLPLLSPKCSLRTEDSGTIKSDLEVCLVDMVQVVAEERLHELQTLNRHYEENFDLSFSTSPNPRCLRSEEELCCQLLVQLS